MMVYVLTNNKAYKNHTHGIITTDIFGLRPKNLAFRDTSLKGGKMRYYIRRGVELDVFLQDLGERCASSIKEKGLPLMYEEFLPDLVDQITDIKNLRVGYSYLPAQMQANLEARLEKIAPRQYEYLQAEILSYIIKNIGSIMSQEVHNEGP